MSAPSWRARWRVRMRELALLLSGAASRGESEMRRLAGAAKQHASGVGKLTASDRKRPRAGRFQAATVAVCHAANASLRNTRRDLLEMRCR